MKALINIFLFLISVESKISAQVPLTNELQDNIATKAISFSGYTDLIAYNNNIRYFLTTGYGNLEYGPKGILTYIHEAAHVYNNIKSTGLYNRRYYWHENNMVLRVELKNGYVTSDNILRILPTSIKDKPLTKTYISCANKCFSNTYGIYGLLEEFNAYALEATALLKMYPYFDSCTYTNNTKFWQGFLKSQYDCISNLNYFRTFFSSYLKYIDANHNEFYRKLIKDTSFIGAFKTIYNKYNYSLSSLNCIEEKVIKRIYSRNKQKYAYPFIQEYNSVKNLSNSPDVTRYISLLLDE